MDILGVTPGSVSPFALINDKERRVTVLLYQAMLAYDELSYHPLINTMTTTIARDDLFRFLGSLGYEPKIVDLS